MSYTAEPDFKCIMLIDDNQIDLRITEFLIQRRKVGDKVLKYSSAIEALEFLKENESNPCQLPEVILLDIHMPLMTGFEFLEEFGKLPAMVREHCNIFMVSSTLDESDLQRARRNTNVRTAFQEKPVTREFLESMKFLIESEMNLL